MPVTRRRTVRRRRNPDAPEAVLAAEALPLLPKREMENLSDKDFFNYRNALTSASFKVASYTLKSGAEGDRAIAAQKRLMNYVYGILQDMALKRTAAQKVAEKAAKKVAATAKRAATMAKKKAEAGFVSSDYFPASMKVRLGERIYVDAGDEFTVMGVALGSDPYSEKYAAAMIAKGVPDKRNHRGDWAVIERGPDAFIVSIGKGVKRNPRRRY